MAAMGARGGIARRAPRAAAGGAGGSETAKFGVGDKAQVNGFDGTKLDEPGGDGGNGGNGCPEGAGGKGGAGDPPGKDGAPGKNICVPPASGSQTAPPDTQIDQPQATDGGHTETKIKVDVIQYQGKYIPVASQLHKEPGHTADPSRSYF